MEKEIDVLTLCNKITEQTKMENCDWKETSERNRYRLSLKNGSVEILHFEPSEFDIVNPEYYDVLLFDNKGERYATYRAQSTQKSFTVFSQLFTEVKNLQEKKRRRKMALLYDELETI